MGILLPALGPVVPDLATVGLLPTVETDTQDTGTVLDWGLMGTGRAQTSLGQCEWLGGANLEQQSQRGIGQWLSLGQMGLAWWRVVTQFIGSQ